MAQPWTGALSSNAQTVITPPTKYSWQTRLPWLSSTLIVSIFEKLTFYLQLLQGWKQASHGRKNWNQSATFQLEALLGNNLNQDFPDS